MLNDSTDNSSFNLSTVTGKYVISSLWSLISSLSPRDKNTLNQRLQMNSAKLKLLTGQEATQLLTNNVQ